MEPRFVRRPVCQEPTPGFMGEVDVQIRKRSQLIDPSRSISDIESADFGVRPTELREDRRESHDSQRCANSGATET